MAEFVPDRAVNNVEKGENAGYHMLFPHCFSKRLFGKGLMNGTTDINPFPNGKF